MDQESHSHRDGKTTAGDHAPVAGCPGRPAAPRIRAVFGIALLASLIAAGPTDAQVLGPESAPPQEDDTNLVTPAEPPQSEEEAIRAVAQPFHEESDEPPVEEPAAEPELEDECDWHLEDKPWQEQSQDVLRSSACHTFRWFDGWWGDEYDYNEEAVTGLVTLGFNYQEFWGFDPRLRLRVRAPLPNMNRRFDLLFGRVDEGTVSGTDAQDRTFYNPGAIGADQEDAWLLGLGHRRGGRGQSGWDYSVGVRLRVPPRPYVRAQYLHYSKMGEDTDLRLRQTFFWRSDQGFGTTSRGDLSHALNARNVLRWEGVVTWSEETEGAQWAFGQTWYHLFANRSAFSLLAFANGATDAPVEVKDFGFNLIWRRPFTRDWMYLSLGPSISWPRLEVEQERDVSLGFGVWLEMEFGSWRY
jgi:hypothetical protein